MRDFLLLQSAEVSCRCASSLMLNAVTSESGVEASRTVVELANGPEDQRDQGGHAGEHAAFRMMEFARRSASAGPVEKFTNPAMK
jgi:hypothetical protein